MVALALPPLALVGWSAFLYSLSGDVLAIAHAPRPWGRELAAPWSPLLRLLTDPGSRTEQQLPDVYFAVVLAILVIGGARVLRRSHTLYSAALFLFMLSSTTISGVPRQGLSIFPAFATIAVVGNSSLFSRLYTAGAFSAAVVFMALFALWFWIA